jgi:hypothetical protein
MLALVLAAISAGFSAKYNATIYGAAGEQKKGSTSRRHPGQERALGPFLPQVRQCASSDLG